MYLAGQAQVHTYCYCDGSSYFHAASLWINTIATNNGDLPVQPNEFDNLFKLVRAKHVKTDVHWTKTWQPTTLIDYDKYGWHGYQYQSKP